MKRIIVALLFILALSVTGLAQSGVPMTVRETDFSPKVTYPTDLIFPNGSLSRSGQRITVTFGTGSFVVGPASATDNAIVRFDLTTGKLVQNSVVTIADTSGNMAGVGTLNTHTIPSGTDTFALLAATQALTGKTINGNTFTSGTYTLTGAAGKTFTFSNTLTLAGTDGSTLDIGAGGTLGSNAFNSTAYLPLAGGTLSGALTITPAASTAALVSTTSNTGSDATSAWTLNHTLNTTGSPDVFALRVTDTARGASTMLVNVYAGASATTSVFSVNRLGTGYFRNGFGIGVNGTGDVFFNPTGDGILTLYNNAFDGFNRLQFGGTSTLFPSIGRSGISLVVQLGDGTMQTFLTPSAAANLQLGAVTGAGAAVAQTLSVQGSSLNSGTPALFTIAGSDQSGTTTTGGGLKIRGGNGTSAGGAVEIWTSATTTPAVAISVAANKNVSFNGLFPLYNNVATAGWGVPAIYTAGRVTAQSAANASIATYTVGAADGSFEVSANMNVTESTTLITTLTCTYTDEANVARTMILPVTQLSGTFITAGAITGTGAWETPVMHIRCKAATAITILTSTGTFTGTVYSAEGIIKQTA